MPSGRCRAEIPVAESRALTTAGGEAGVDGVDREDMGIQMRPRGSGSERRRPVRSDRGKGPGFVDDAISHSAGGCLEQDGRPKVASARGGATVIM